MKVKLLLVLLILSTFSGYLEWGNRQSTFILEAEKGILLQINQQENALKHPLILLPLLGQICLLLALFIKKRQKLLAITGTICTGLLLWFLFFIGIFSGNLKILTGATPFLILSVYLVYTLSHRNTQG